MLLQVDVIAQYIWSNNGVSAKPHRTYEQEYVHVYGNMAISAGRFQKKRKDIHPGVVP